MMHNILTLFPKKKKLYEKLLVKHHHNVLHLSVLGEAEPRLHIHSSFIQDWLNSQTVRNLCGTSGFQMMEFG